MPAPEAHAEKPAFVRDTVIRELEYRRKKQWDIFSWASTLLTAITGGLIALKTSAPPHTLTCGHHLVLTVAVLALFGYSITWIHNNLSLEEEAEKALTTLNELLPKLTIPEGSRITARIGREIGYGVSLVLLTAATLTSIWIPA